MARCGFACGSPELRVAAKLTKISLRKVCKPTLAVTRQQATLGDRWPNSANSEFLDLMPASAHIVKDIIAHASTIASGPRIPAA